MESPNFLLEILTFYGEKMFPYPEIMKARTNESQKLKSFPLRSKRCLEYTLLPLTNCNRLSFQVFNLHRLSCKKHTTKNTHKIRVPSSIYELMLMTKEFNNENHWIKQNNIHGKGNFICINEIEREITTKSLVLINPFSSKPFLQSFNLVYQMLTLLD